MLLKGDVSFEIRRFMDSNLRFLIVLIPGRLDIKFFMDLHATQAPLATICFA
jgi:hypothetical protein